MLGGALVAPFSRLAQRASLLAGAAATATRASAQAQADNFPARALTLVVPYPPGGATDTIARVLARAMGERLGASVVVENKAGAGTAIGAGAVAQSAADGHTLLISSDTTFTINPALKDRLPYDPQTSFESIGIVGSSPLVLLANPRLPADDVAGLVALARREPGKIAWGSFGNGTSSHLAGAMFAYAAGIQLLHVPYKGSSPAMTDLVGGQIALTVDTMVAALPMLRSGKVKALAVTSAQRSASLPDVPTIAGYPGYEMVPWVAVVGRRGMPAATRTKLADALAASIADSTIRAELSRAGLDVAYEPGNAYDTRVASGLPRLREFVKRAGIHVD